MVRLNSLFASENMTSATEMSETVGRRRPLPAMTNIGKASLAIGGLAVLSIAALRLYTTVAPTQDGESVPITVGVAIWLIYRRWRELAPTSQGGVAPLAYLLMATSAALFIYARVLDRTTVELYGVVGLVASLIYYLNGFKVVRGLAIPFLALIFAIPMPTQFIAFLTLSSKAWATNEAMVLLNQLGIDVVRDGFNVMVDQYVLTVKDACSGLNSLISLTWAGLIYIYLRRSPPWYYFLIMAAPIIALAETANLVRIIILVLLTHFFGDSVAQGVLHETAGLLMFAIALSAVFGLDLVVYSVADWLKARKARER